MGKKGSRLRDVAAMAGVSIATVSRLLNNRKLLVPVSDETRRRVLEAARALDYKPNRLARGLVTDKTNIIGVSLAVFIPPDRPLPKAHAVHSAALAAFLDGIRSITLPAGFDILLLHRREYGKSDVHPRMDLGLDFIDGLLYDAPDPRYDHYSVALESEVPIVMVGFDPTDGKVSSVDVDNVAEVFRITRTLLKNGHKRVALVLPMELEVPLSRERFQGYRQALDDAGIPFEQDLVMVADFEDDAGQRIAAQLLAIRPEPTAVFVARNDLAVDILYELKQAGRKCPDDVEIVVFGDSHAFESTNPQLTALDDVFFDLGVQGARLLFEVMGGGALPKRLRVPCRLMQRESCRLNGVSSTLSHGKEG